MPQFSAQDATSRRLLQLGVLLVLVGLLLGLVVPILTNPRMGLSSHLEALMNGLLLVGVGLLWPKLSLSTLLLEVTFWLLLFGSYANVLATFLAAVWGTSRMTPIAGQGHTGTPSHEWVIRALLVSLSLAMLVACSLLLVGLRAPMERSER